MYLHSESSSDTEHSSERQSDQSKKKSSHILSEQKRRNAIKVDKLEIEGRLLGIGQTAGEPGGPAVDHESFQDEQGGDSAGGLVGGNRVTEQIKYQNRQKASLQREIDKFEKEIYAVTVMKSHYEDILEAYRKSGGCQETKMDSQQKLQIFKGLMEEMFASFDSEVACDSFSSLASSTISWVERFCSRTNIQKFMQAALEKLD